MDPRLAIMHTEMVRRAQIIKAAEGNTHLQGALLEESRRDVVAFFRHWVWTYDPRMMDPWPKRMPMVLWPKQEEFLRWAVELIRKGDNGLLKKARDIGATWMVGGLGVWLWLFTDEAAVTYGSRKEDLVDKLGDPKTIFAKIRDIIRLLPSWMLPPGWSPEHDNFCRILNPHNGSTLTGEAGDNMGRGGRSLLYLLDEFAFVEHAQSVDAAVNDNARTVLYLSTSNGNGTLFYQKEQEQRCPLFRFHWSDDPRKDAAWKLKKLEEVGPVTFAREHEMDDAAALDGVVIPGSWVQAAVGLDLDPGSVCVAGLDVADGGGDETVMIVRRGGLVTSWDSWGGAITVTESAQRAAHICEDEGARLNFDRVGIGAGVQGELDRIPRGFGYEGIVAQATPTRIRYEDDAERPACERFANLSAEMWWSLKLRFWRTYQHVNGEREYPHDELIALPREIPVRLISQLSGRLCKTTSTGKTALESKDEMRRRGVKSPDWADALALAFCPPLKIQIAMSFDAGTTRKVS
jgi:phage terminase large subunit